MMTGLLRAIALLTTGAAIALGQVAIAGGAVAVFLVTAAIQARRRAVLIAKTGLTGSRGRLRLASESGLSTVLGELSETLQALEWDRDLITRMARPLEDHPLIKELSQPAELRKFSGVELYQRILTIIAGFTRAQAAGIAFHATDGCGVVGYGVKGRRFEQHLRALAEELWRGNRSVLGAHDSFGSGAIWGGSGSFGHRFSLTLAFDVTSEAAKSESRLALVWLGYAHGSRPSVAEEEAAKQLLASVSRALRSTQRLVALDTRAENAESEKNQTSQMLAHVSHDIRTPLSNVKAILHLIGEEQRSAIAQDATTDVGELVRVALQNCEELGELVGDVIDFTRGRAGQLVAQREPVDLESIARRVVSSSSINARQRGLALTIDSSGPVWVLGDAGHLKRAITNLVSNGLKYTQHGEVRVRFEQDGSESRAARLVVQDTGLGMDEGQLAKLFTPFTRFHRNQAEGIGLGLAITKLFIEAHQGQITVRSRPNEGTTFRIELPLLATHAVDIPSPARKAAALAPRVLVVDDDPDLGASLTRLLEKSGCAVGTVCSVSAATEMIPRKKYDVVITDLKMPGGGGRAVLDIALAGPASEVAVFVLSGDADAATVKELKARGATEVFEKPVDLSVLIQAIHAVVETRARRTVVHG